MWWVRAIFVCLLLVGVVGAPASYFLTDDKSVKAIVPVPYVMLVVASGFVLAWLCSWKLGLVVTIVLAILVVALDHGWFLK